MAELRAYTPTWKDRLAGLLMGDERASPERRRFVEGLLGSSGLGSTGISVSDFTPLGIPLGAQEAIAEGNYRGAALAGVPLVGRPAAAAKGAAKEGAKILNEARVSAPAVISSPETGPQTVANPQRIAYPGIYDNPKTVVERATAQVAPENPAMKQLFGVTRDDLFEMSKRVGNAEPDIRTKAKARGSDAASALMTPQNEQRLIDTLAEAQKSPDLYKGMHAWYTMDPAYQRLVQLAGEDGAKHYYNRLNTLTGMASPGSDVLTEINRGTGANMMAELGRFNDFYNVGGTAAGNRGANFPPELQNVIGHPYHSTAQAPAMQTYLEKGIVDMDSPKVPLYIQSSGVPETGFQTKWPVPDAHFTRAIGMADTRGSKKPGVSMKMPEYQPVAPWFYDNVAQKAGMEGVPAQATLWGAYAPATGVDSPIGAPKLELLTQRIMQRAKELNLPPEVVRDQVLLGKQHAGWMLPAAGVGGGLLGGSDMEN